MNIQSSRGLFRLLARQIVVLITLLGFVGCTSLQTIDPPDSVTVPAEVDVGSDIEILMKNGQTYRVEVAQFIDKGIRGKIVDGGDGKVYLFRYEQIAKITQKKISALKTSLTVVGVVLAIGGIVIGVLVNNYNRGNN